jgi:hypothetical protein
MSGLVPTADRRRSPLVGFLLSRATSMLGDGVFEIAFPVIAIERTGSPPLAGVAVGAQQVPGIFLGPAAGSLDTPLGRRALLIASDLWRVAVLLLLLAALTADAPLAPALILAAVGLGIRDTSVYVSSGSIWPSLVERPRLISANAALESMDAGATVLAPIIAGVLLQVMGGPSGVGFDAISFLISAALLERVTRRFGRRQTPSRLRLDTGTLRRGLPVILRSSPQRSVTALQLVMNLQAGAAVLLLVSYRRIRTHMAEIMMGVALAGAVGGGAGSCLVVPRLTKLGWGSLVGGLVLLLVLG